MRCLLIEPFPESALNEQAGKMLLENYADYARHARLPFDFLWSISVSLCQYRLGTPRRHLYLPSLYMGSPFLSFFFLLGQNLEYCARLGDYGCDVFSSYAIAIAF